MKIICAFLFTLALLVSTPSIAVPTGLHCLPAGNQEPVFLVLDVQVSTVSVLDNQRVDAWNQNSIGTTVDIIRWVSRFTLDYTPWNLDRKTLVLSFGSPATVRITVDREWQCNIMSEQELRSKATQYQRSLVQGNKI